MDGPGASAKLDERLFEAVPADVLGICRRLSGWDPSDAELGAAVDAVGLSDTQLDLVASKAMHAVAGLE